MHGSQQSAPLFAGYTYSKSIDALETSANEINPFDYSLSRLVSFDMRHNFVASYNYSIPFGPLLRASSDYRRMDRVRHNPAQHGTSGDARRRLGQLASGDSGQWS